MLRTHDRVASQNHLVVAIMVGKNHIFGAVGDVAVGLLPPPLLQGSFSLVLHSFFSRRGATALSPRGLSFPSDGEPLPTISFVGTAARVVKSDVLAPPGRLERRPVGRSVHRIKLHLLGGSGERFRPLDFYADDVDT